MRWPLELATTRDAIQRLLAQNGLLEFTGSGFRQRLVGSEKDVARQLVGGEKIAKIVLDLFGGDRAVGASHDPGAAAFAEPIVGHAD